MGACLQGVARSATPRPPIPAQEAAVWQVEFGPEESGWPGGYWVDYEPEWNTKLESAYQWRFGGRYRAPVVELWHDEKAEDYVQFEVDIRAAIQISAATGTERRVRRVIVSHG